MKLQIMQLFGTLLDFLLILSPYEGSILTKPLDANINITVNFWEFP